MMADLMRDDIGLGELAGVAVSAATEFVLEVIEKGGVQINPLVTWAIERAHGRPGEGARRWLRAGEQPQLRRVVSFSAGGKDFSPAILRVPKPLGHQLSFPILRGSGSDRRCRTLLSRRVAPC